VLILENTLKTSSNDLQITSLPEFKIFSLFLSHFKLMPGYKTIADDKDPVYFSYYAQFANQQNMLSDTIRTKLYKLAIESAQDHIQDKRVMDVGAGSGIFSIRLE
jgi:hypothetical protein